MEIVDLTGERRELAVPVVLDAYTGIYRWHAKRTLFEVPEVRAVLEGDGVVAVSMLDDPAPEVGYVYYLLVLAEHRARGLGGRLLDDALGRFRAARKSVAYAATGEENVGMTRLLLRRGFRAVARKERGYREGGLGAWGLRSRMRVVYGEALYGLRLREAESTVPTS